MVSIPLGAFGPVTKHAVSAATATFTGERPYASYAIKSDRKVLISRKVPGGDELADTEAFPLNEDEVAYVDLMEEEILYFVIQSGETDGHVWITGVSI